jgi:hypothetical protein
MFINQIVFNYFVEKCDVDEFKILMYTNAKPEFEFKVLQVIQREKH